LLTADWVRIKIRGKTEPKMQENRPCDPTFLQKPILQIREKQQSNQSIAIFSQTTKKFLPFAWTFCLLGLSTNVV